MITIARLYPNLMCRIVKVLIRDFDLINETIELGDRKEQFSQGQFSCNFRVLFLFLYFEKNCHVLLFSQMLFISHVQLIYQQ